MMQAVARGITSSSRASSSAASPNPCCRKVLVDMPNALSRSNFQWRGKSVAASVSFDSSIPSEVWRIPKHERCAMVVSFVDKYQATNAGKFPSASLICQQIGGSYYTVREILQGLEYKSKFSPLKETQDFPLDKVEEDTYSSSDARKEPSLNNTKVSVCVSVESCILNEQSNIVVSFSEEIIEGIKVDKAPTDDTEAYEASCHASTTSAISSSRDSEADVTVSIGSHSAQAKSEATQDQPKSFSGEPDGSRGGRDALKEAAQKGSKELSGAEDLFRDIGRELEHEEASPKRSTVWGNLKSLAHGIMNFWKNKWIRSMIATEIL